MAIDFTTVESTIDQTKTEVAEHEAAITALTEARVILTTAQDAVASAQAAVTEATEATTKEKADVIAGITDAINQLNVILTELQG